METRLRTLAKAATWQAVGLVMMTAITFAATGSLATGGAIALSSALTGTVFYVLHERVWAQVGWGLAAARPADARVQTASSA